MATVNYTFSLSTLLLTALLCIIYVVFSRTRLHFRQKAFAEAHGCQPVAIAPHQFDPIFGLDGMIKIIQAARQHRLLDYFHDLIKRHGRNGVFLSKTWLKATVITSNAENIKTMLATNFDDWAVKDVRQPPGGALFGEGIFSTDGAFWAHSRAMLRPNFAKEQVADLDQFEKGFRALLECLPKDGRTVELQELFHRLTMDTSSEFLFGESTNTLGQGGDGKLQKFAEFWDYAMDDIMLRNRTGRLYFLWPHPKATKAIKFCRDAVNEYVVKAMAIREQSKEAGSDHKIDGKYVFLAELAKHPEADATRIRDEVLNVLIAGRDTTAALLSSLWHQLARHPDVWAKLLTEVDTLEGKLPTYDRLRNMPYIKHCCSETLRLFPPVPLLAKMAIRDTWIPYGGGPDGNSPLFIAKDTMMVYNMQDLHRQEDVYGKHAAAFNPDRWADASLRPGWNFLPFGGGARVCLGQQYALTEAYYITIRLMQYFRKIEQREPEPWVENVSVTCSSFHGVKVGLHQE